MSAQQCPCNKYQPAINCRNSAYVALCLWLIIATLQIYFAAVILDELNGGDFTTLAPCTRNRQNFGDCCVDLSVDATIEVNYTDISCEALDAAVIVQLMDSIC